MDAFGDNNLTRQATIEWLKGFDTNNFEWVTLLFRQRARRECVDGVVRFDTLDEIKASRCLRGFLNRLNQKIFQNEYRRNNKGLRVLPFLERKNGNYHYHIGIENPFEGDVGRAQFIALMRLYWGRNPFAFVERVDPKTGCYGERAVKVIETYNDRWIDYCLKYAANNTNEPDYNNLRLGS